MAAENTNVSNRILVEFYDSEYLENIISLLRGSYSGVVYVYFSRANEPTNEDRAALHEYVRNNYGFKPAFLKIEENTVDCALKSFRELVRDGNVYDFDITGGSSVFIAAAGALTVDRGEGRVFLHEYDPATGKRIFSHPENTMVAKGRTSTLTVDHVLALRGIDIMPSNQPVRYRLDRDNLRGEILRLWDVVRKEFKAWNAFNGIAAKIDHRGRFDVTNKDLNNYSDLVNSLSDHGIISRLNKHSSDSVTYQLNVPESAWFLYKKAGNILEMLTYLAVKDSGRFADCCTGISLDWENSSRRGTINTYNEIDTIMTAGHIPCFVSCKNTSATKEFLYEIMVMTRHYGGKYAIPVLICTSACNASIHNRAKEMGVFLLDNIARLSADEFSEKLTMTLCR